MKKFSFLIVLILTLALAKPVNAAVYTYDELNRLSSVIYNNGEKFTYTYDAGGNLLSFNAGDASVIYEAIPDNSVIIWSKAYSIDYLMDENNLAEINQSISDAGLKPIYFQLPGVADVFTDVFTLSAVTPGELGALPEIEYTDKQGNKVTYAAGFGGTY